MEVDDQLRIYLQDHAAGAFGGLELARRIAGSNKGNEYGRFFEDLADQVADDRRELEAVMRRLGVGSNPIKQGAAWMAEKVGRAKLNGVIDSFTKAFA